MASWPMCGLVKSIRGNRFSPQSPPDQNSMCDFLSYIKPVSNSFTFITHEPTNSQLNPFELETIRR